MRIVALAVLALGAFGTPVRAGEIFTWTDKSGAVHYSNTVAPGGQRVVMTDSDSTPSAAPATPAGEQQAATGASADDAGTFSTQASLQRTSIERGLRDVERRLAALDARLAGDARLRADRARGSVETGGVGGDPTVESDDEKRLREQRKELADRHAALQGDYAKLRTAVTTRLGETPAWWIDYRPARR